jgi:hypothetical protein
MHWSVVTALLTTQVAIGLHYLPVLPIQFGLLLTGLCYSIIVFAITFEKETHFKKSWMEATIILTLFVGLALIVHP